MGWFGLGSTEAFDGNSGVGMSKSTTVRTLVSGFRCLGFRVSGFRCFLFFSQVGVEDLSVQDPAITA